jgi:TRAP-type uncharacterized transport system substrate-binding protein
VISNGQEGIEPQEQDLTPTVGSPPPRPQLLNRATFMVLGALLLAMLAGVVLVRIFYHPTDRVTMSTGSFAGANYGLANRYLVPAARARNLELSLLETGGSEDTLNSVQDGRVQVAIADGGLNAAGRANVREVAPLFLTALHVLMKREIYDEAVATGNLRAAFRGKTISMSNPGSGTRFFALKELERFGVTTADFTELPRSVSFLVDPKTTAGEVPDIVFAASLLPSPVATRLVQDFGYRLFPFDYVDAVRLGDQSVYGVTIPRGTYGLSPDVPDRSVTTLGYRLLLVAHEDVPDAAVVALAHAVFDSDFAKAYEPALTTKQFDLLPEYPRHPGTQAFLASKEPIKQEDFGSLLQLLLGAGALACFPPAYFILRDALRRFRAVGRGKSLRLYIAAVSDLEAQAIALDESSPRSRGGFLALRRQLNQLKLEAMDAYDRNLIDDANLMPSFLAHVADLRSHLNAVLLPSMVSGGSPALTPQLAISQASVVARAEPALPEP